MKKDMNTKGVLILLVFFVLFYFIANYFLGKENNNKQDINHNREDVINEKENYDEEKKIVTGLYNNVKILYDVVNNKFKVSQDDVIIMGDITYKKITNFDEVMSSFTKNGVKKYISDMRSYFAYTDSGYYLAGNLVTYQTYYFRGDNANIYIEYADEDNIDGIIYEKWTSNNKNTLATISVVKENNTWLIDEINILATE